MDSPHALAPACNMAYIIFAEGSICEERIYSRMMRSLDKLALRWDLKRSGSERYDFLNKEGMWKKASDIGIQDVRRKEGVITGR